jgi:hypothetical protein
MNIKIAMVITIVGILVLCQVLTTPIANQTFAQTNEANQHTGKCTSELNIQAHSTLLDKSGSIGVPNGQTAPVTIQGALSCGGAAIDGAMVHISMPSNCGSAFGEQPTTNANGAFDTGIINLGPCPTPYNVQAQYAGDSTHEPATASTGFYIDETK